MKYMKNQETLRNTSRFVVLDCFTGGSRLIAFGRTKKSQSFFEGNFSS
jgi:hypothetical protein